MELSEYFLEEHGIQADLAKVLNVSPVLISQWASGVRPVPAERCYPIEQATNGKVSRIDLRPNDWRILWPELIEKQSASV